MILLILTSSKHIRTVVYLKGNAKHILKIITIVIKHLLHAPNTQKRTDSVE